MCKSKATTVKPSNLHLHKKQSFPCSPPNSPPAPMSQHPHPSTLPNKSPFFCPVVLPHHTSDNQQWNLWTKATLGTSLCSEVVCTHLYFDIHVLGALDTTHNEQGGPRACTVHLLIYTCSLVRVWKTICKKASGRSSQLKLLVTEYLWCH